jgi:hypothetical protein
MGQEPDPVGQLLEHTKQKPPVGLWPIPQRKPHPILTNHSAIKN